MEQAFLPGKRHRLAGTAMVQAATTRRPGRLGRCDGDKRMFRQPADRKSRQRQILILQRWPAKVCPPVTDGNYYIPDYPSSYNSRMGFVATTVLAFAAIPAIMLWFVDGLLSRLANVIEQEHPPPKAPNQPEKPP